MENLPLWVVALAVIIIILSKTKKSKKSYNYVRREIMTQAEKKFFAYLQQSAPDLLFFPQVSAFALLDLKYKKDFGSQGKIQSKRVDFIAYNQQNDTLCVIELDDSTHVKSKDAERDEFFNSVGIKVLRYTHKNKPNSDILRDEILNSLA